MRVAVVGAGISGLAAAHALATAGVEVVLYEKEEYLGGHAKTVAVDGVDVDLGFMVFNRVTYPNTVEFWETLGVDMETSDMSFSVSLDGGKGCEWGSRNGLTGLFAQRRNAINPYFWRMIREIVRFKDDVIRTSLNFLEKSKGMKDISPTRGIPNGISNMPCKILFSTIHYFKEKRRRRQGDKKESKREKEKDKENLMCAFLFSSSPFIFL